MADATLRMPAFRRYDCGLADGGGRISGLLSCVRSANGREHRCAGWLSGLRSHVLLNVAEEFGWRVHAAHDLRDLIAAQTLGNVLGLMFHFEALGLSSSLDAVRRLRLSLPRVRLITCHGFSEAVNWAEISQAGAFHSLRLPLKENELRQSFGFIWQAEKRLAGSAKEIPPAAVLLRKRSVRQRMAVPNG